MTADRIKCVVPFCRRTRKPDCTEMICGKHWRMVSRTLRDRKIRMNRRYRRRFGDNAPWDYPAGSAMRLESVKLARICGKAWEACKRSAIEAAAGI